MLQVLVLVFFSDCDALLDVMGIGIIYYNVVSYYHSYWLKLQAFVLLLLHCYVCYIDYLSLLTSLTSDLQDQRTKK